MKTTWFPSLILGSTFLMSSGCPVKPPELPAGPDRPGIEPLALLDPGAEVTLIVRPRALSASPLGAAAEGWFEPTPEEAARGGPALWFRELGGADEAIVSFAREDDLEPARAVRGGPDDGRALARRLAERAEAERAPIAERPCADVTSFAVGGSSLAAVGADLFVLGPDDTVDRACRRAAGEERASLASDPRVAPLAERLERDAAQIVYLGRVPPSLRPQLRHWGVDPLFDRIVGVSVTIGDRETGIRAVAQLDGEASATELVRTATEGLEFMASRRSFSALGVSPLIRKLVPRSEGAFFFVEGPLPTAAIAVVLAQLRTVEEAQE